MAWKKYTPSLPVKTMAPVAINIPESDKQNRPFLLIDEATLRSLGWKADASLQLAIGDGEHDGKIRIEPMAGEPTRLRMPNKGMKQRRARVLLGRMPCLAGEEFKGALPFEIEPAAQGGKALVVTLPDDARAHRLPPRTAAAVSAASKK